MDEAIAVKERHQAALLACPNVVGVAVGVRDGAPVVAVFVRRCVPRDQLAEHEVIPAELDGVRVDVVETGGFGTL
jgi:hypothetical protein